MKLARVPQGQCDIKSDQFFCFAGSGDYCFELAHFTRKEATLF